MELLLNGVTVSVNEKEVAKIVRQHIVGSQQSTARTPTAAPTIGAVWPGQGGIYAGIVRGEEGKPDCHLIVPPGDKGDINWNDAVKWAGSIEHDGHNDFTLPERKEQAVLFGNVPELFEKTWYWSNEQYAPDPDYAWNQNFGDGTQDIYDGRVLSADSQSFSNLII
jgi:hypothetical protein